ncbi:unnamed protein product [Darwinula stevensoni]|uniref:Malectin domain-containing protein n=1 Tax=Darwinula stevensoni TaxID=69355 RepID=A0A7R9A1Y1_9CRUS|nr:unnamed protein product [Darwinula stevensoni]CAG0884549.1 unnamed protein product [Darwinula stevensoni]
MHMSISLRHSNDVLFTGSCYLFKSPVTRGMTFAAIASFLAVFAVANVVADYHVPETHLGVDEPAPDKAGDKKNLDVIYAINAGGDAHVDVMGIKYRRDPLHGQVGAGIASDYGKRLLIARVPQEDQILYQTERYHRSTFGYDLPLAGDGNYHLLLKFSEVYFNEPRRKVFDVVLNHEHTVISNLDIFDEVGRGVAHDDVVHFTVRKGGTVLQWDEEESNLDENGKSVRVDFVKGPYDNPKINAIVLLKGDPDAEVPKLPPLEEEELPGVGDQSYKKEEWEKVTGKSKFASGSKISDPYSGDDSSMMLPIFVAIGCFIPVIFCLCKL